MKLKKAFALAAIALAVTSLFASTQTEELMAKAQEYKNRKQWVYAAGTYADIISINPYMASQAYTNLYEILDAWESGKPGLGTYSKYLEEDWKATLLDAEKYWSENFGSHITLSYPKESYINSKTRTSTYTTKVTVQRPAYFERDYGFTKYSLIMSAIQNGYNKVKQSDWLSVSLNSDESWPVLPAGKSKDVPLVNYRNSDNITAYNAFALGFYSLTLKLVDEKGKTLALSQPTLLNKYETSIDFTSIDEKTSALIDQKKVHVEVEKISIKYGDWKTSNSMSLYYWLHEDSEKHTSEYGLSENPEKELKAFDIYQEEIVGPNLERYSEHYEYYKYTDSFSGHLVIAGRSASSKWQTFSATYKDKKIFYSLFPAEQFSLQDYYIDYLRKEHGIDFYLLAPQDFQAQNRHVAQNQDELLSLLNAIGEKPDYYNGYCVGVRSLTDQELSALLDEQKALAKPILEKSKSKLLEYDSYSKYMTSVSSEADSYRNAISSLEQSLLQNDYCLIEKERKSLEKISTTKLDTALAKAKTLSSDVEKATAELEGAKQKLQTYQKYDSSIWDTSSLRLELANLKQAVTDMENLLSKQVDSYALTNARYKLSSVDYKYLDRKVQQIEAERSEQKSNGEQRLLVAGLFLTESPEEGKFLVKSLTPKSSASKVLIEGDLICVEGVSSLEELYYLAGGMKAKQTLTVTVLRKNKKGILEQKEANIILK